MGNATENVAKQHELHSRVGHLKERIYVTFTLLAVSITLASHVPEHALEAVFTIFVTVLGSVLAALTAELLSHMILHERWLDASELREVLRGSWGALASITPSLLMVASSMLGGVVAGFVAVQRWAGVVVPDPHCLHGSSQPASNSGAAGGCHFGGSCTRLCGDCSGASCAPLTWMWIHAYLHSHRP